MVIAGDVARDFIYRDGSQAFDLVGLFKPITKLAAGEVVVLDGRRESVTDLMHNLDQVQQTLAASGLSAAPLSQI